MYVQLLKENLSRLIELRNELEQIKPNQQLYKLRDYIEIIQSCINSVDHGVRDKFLVPQYHASLRLQRLRELDEKKFVTAFVTQKKVLLSISDQYIRDMQSGFRLNEKELGNL